MKVRITFDIDPPWTADSDNYTPAQAARDFMEGRNGIETGVNNAVSEASEAFAKSDRWPDIIGIEVIE